MIKWKEGRYSSTYGFAGRWNIFNLSYSTTRNDPKPWVLSSSLPGMERNQYKTPDEAKAGAVAQWAAWLRSAGVR